VDVPVWAAVAKRLCEGGTSVCEHDPRAGQRHGVDVQQVQEVARVVQRSHGAGRAPGSVRRVHTNAGYRYF
jgi:hypothetical protein